MFGKDKVSKCTKILFHILQIIILLFGVFSMVLSIFLFAKTDSLIPLPVKYLAPAMAICILSIVNGYLGFVCLNSERKTKTFLFILTLCCLLNLQIFLAIKSNNIVENSSKWTNGRWNSFSLQQRSYIQKQFGCCGLETVNDRAAGKCNFDIPCGPFFEKMLKTIRSVIQKILIYMFFVETVSLSTYGFLKFIK